MKTAFAIFVLFLSVGQYAKAEGTIEGMVYNCDGITPLQGARVITYNNQNEIVAIDTSSTSGQYGLSLPSGTYRQNLTRFGFIPCDLNNIVVAPSETTYVEAIMFLGGIHYIVGDVNGNIVFNGLDVVYAVRYLKGGPPPPFSLPCPIFGWYVAGDVNASCTFDGLDVTYMVRYFKGGSTPVPCPYCPPVYYPLLIKSGK